MLSMAELALASLQSLFMLEPFPRILLAENSHNFYSVAGYAVINAIAAAQTAAIAIADFINGGVEKRLLGQFRKPFKQCFDIVVGLSNTPVFKAV